MPDLLDRLKTALADRYRVEREIGRGGMATVYLAEDLKHHRPVALKVLKPELAAALGPERFLREIELAARLTHPHILPLHDSGNADGFLYYVMPYVEGESLRDRLTREKQLPVDDALQISREVADALSYAHSHGVIHRDIKPENILLESGHAVVADFGIARAIDAAGGERLTETGVAMGTPQYMSPEQAGGSKDLDGRSDLYSLGCVLYEMLAGQPPFTGPTVESLVRQHLSAEPPNITNIRPSVPSWVVSALQRALAKTPADRFNPVAQFGEAIAPRVSTAEIAPSPALRRGSLARLLAVAAVAVAVVVGGWFSWVALRGAAPPTPTGRPIPYTIIADVDGSAPAETRDAVKKLIATRIDQSGVLRIVPDGDLERGLALASLPDTTRVGVRVARELAVRGSIRTVIATWLDRLGESFALTVQVLQAENAAVVVAHTEEAEGEDALIRAVGTAVDGLRRGLGERAAEIRANRTLGEVATASFAAFRHWAAASDAFRGSLDGGPAKCREETHAAIALDSEFAAAWSLLGLCYNNVGLRDSAIAAWERAWAFRHRLSDQARWDLETYLALLRDADPSVALAAARRAGNPRSEAMVLAEKFGLYREAAELYARARDESPFGPTPLQLLNSARTLIAAGRLAEAESLILLMPNPRPSAWLGLAAIRHDWVGLERLARAWTADPSNAGSFRGTQALAGALAARGRIAHAANELRAVGPAAANWAWGEGDIAADEWLLAFVRRGMGGADTPRPPQIERREWQGIWAAQDGDSVGALTLIRGADSVAVIRRGRKKALELLAQALLAMRRGSPQQAVMLLSPERYSEFQLHRWWILAEAHQQGGSLDSAAAYLQRTIASAGIQDESNLVIIGLGYSFAHFRLARLYTELEQYDRAEEHYLTFLETFTEPDPEYEWMVTEARTKLEELARGR